MGCLEEDKAHALNKARVSWEVFGKVCWVVWVPCGRLHVVAERYGARVSVNSLRSLRFEIDKVFTVPLLSTSVVKVDESLWSPLLSRLTNRYTSFSV